MNTSTVGTRGDIRFFEQIIIKQHPCTALYHIGFQGKICFLQIPAIDSFKWKNLFIVSKLLLLTKN
jgi:hypothetical protein